jgi:hypothetical protein
VGLYLDEQEICMSQVASTLLGPVEIASARVPYAPDDLPAALRPLLKPFTAGKRRATVAVGMPAGRFFFATRSLRGTDGDASPEVLLQRALRSPTISVDDLIVDMTRTELGKIPLATMAACRRKQLTGLLAVLESCGVRPARIEPGPCALVRAAVLRRHAPWRAKAMLRVFLHARRGLAVMVAGNQPMAWWNFTLPPGEERGAIQCAVRTLQTLAKYSGIETPLKTAIVHGRADLHEMLGQEDFGAEIGVRIAYCPDPELDGPAMAFGLALGCMKPDLRALDLSRMLKPRVSIRQIFPWGEMLFQGGLVFCVGILLAVRSISLHDAGLAARIANQAHPCLATPLADLERQRRDLYQKVDAIEKFLGTRILWSNYTHDIPAQLPPNARINAIQGFAEMEAVGRRESIAKSKRSLLIQATAPLSSAGAVPREVDALLDALRNLPLLKRDFPVVELADIKRYRMAGMAPTANFTVICTPGADKGAAPPAPDAGSTGNKGKKK